jgi:hypothetical protein
MPAPSGGKFAAILSARRSRFNGQFVDAHRYRPALDPQVFAQHLTRVIGPVVESVAEHEPGQAAAVAEALYDLSLDLVGREFLGPNSRYPALAEGWSWLFGRLPDRLAEAPRLFPAAVTNALHNLSTTPGARPRDWMQAVVALSAVCRDVHELLSAAQVAAWRAGLAHFRLSALERCRALDPRAAAVALGLSAGDGQPALTPWTLDTLINALLADPWLDPAAVARGAIVTAPARLELVRRVGAFRGFGGLFMAPPTVSCPGGLFVATDHRDHWLLFADRFGATFHRIESPPDEKPHMSVPLYQVSLDGTVSKGLYSAHFPELERSQSSAANTTTLAVTTPLSHAVYLIAPVTA